MVRIDQVTFTFLVYRSLGHYYFTLVFMAEFSDITCFNAFYESTIPLAPIVSKGLKFTKHFSQNCFSSQRFLYLTKTYYDKTRDA